MAYTEEFLVIGYQVWDVDIYATLTDRKAKVWQEEAVELFIRYESMEPNQYYEFQLSPKNVLRDLQITNRRGCQLEINDHWTCHGMKTAVQKIMCDSFRGWTAEMALPLASLIKSSEKSNVLAQNWRMNVFRIDRKPRLEFSAWAPTYQDTFHVLDRFGTLIFG